MGKKKDKLAAQQQQQQQQQVPWKTIDKDPLGFLVGPEVSCLSSPKQWTASAPVDSLNTTSPTHLGTSTLLCT
jgi:hypothetical protein